MHRYIALGGFFAGLALLVGAVAVGSTHAGPGGELETPEGETIFVRPVDPLWQSAGPNCLTLGFASDGDLRIERACRAPEGGCMTEVIEHHPGDGGTTSHPPGDCTADSPGHGGDICEGWRAGWPDYCGDAGGEDEGTGDGDGDGDSGDEGKPKGGNVGVGPTAGGASSAMSGRAAKQRRGAFAAFAVPVPTPRPAEPTPPPASGPRVPRLVPVTELPQPIPTPDGPQPFPEPTPQPRIAATPAPPVSTPLRAATPALPVATPTPRPVATPPPQQAPRPGVFPAWFDVPNIQELIRLQRLQAAPVATPPPGFVPPSGTGGWRITAP